jgi:5'-deoxynucleotidase YfbR-like HD superfamily hydrolase
VEAIAGHVEPEISPRDRLVVLLHDAPEYVVGDMISPFKAVIGDAYKAVEKRLLAAIHLRFGLPALTPAALNRLTKRADAIAAFLEATRLAGFSREEALKFFGRPVPLPRDVEALLAPWSAGEAESRYRERVLALSAA